MDLREDSDVGNTSILAPSPSPPKLYIAVSASLPIVPALPTTDSVPAAPSSEPAEPTNTLIYNIAVLAEPTSEPSKGFVVPTMPATLLTSDIAVPPVPASESSKGFVLSVVTALPPLKDNSPDYHLAELALPVSSCGKGFDAPAVPAPQPDLTTQPATPALSPPKEKARKDNHASTAVTTMPSGKRYLPVLPIPLPPYSGLQRGRKPPTRTQAMFNRGTVLQPVLTRGMKRPAKDSNAPHLANTQREEQETKCRREDDDLEEHGPSAEPPPCITLMDEQKARILRSKSS